MGSALVDPERRLRDDLRGAQRRVGDGYNLIVVSVHDEGWDGDPLQILREIRLGPRLDAEVGRGEAGHHALVNELLAHALRHLDRKSTRLNSSHANISYAVFCLKKII